MEYSMGFHDTLAPPNEVSLISMIFHGILRLSCYSMSYYPGLPWDIPWNSVEIWSRQIKNHRVPWDSMEWGGRHYKWHRCSMEFHGIPWNSGAAKWNINKFHGIPWNIQWNSMELWDRQMNFHLVPWNAMELWGCHFMTCYPGLPRDIPWNCTELWSWQIKNHRVPWNIPWNSMCRQMKYDFFLWNSMELWNCHFKRYHGTLDLHGIFHGIPWNSGVAK